MTPIMLAQAAAGGVVYWLVIVIVVAAVVAIVYIVLQQMGVAIPPFIVKIFWVLVAAVIGILAVKFLIGLL